MKFLVLFGLFLVLLNVKAEDDLSCRIKEIENWSPTGFKIEPPIEDTHEGPITKFTTENIEGMDIAPIIKNVYLTATFEKNILTILTTERFKEFEKDRKGTQESGISIEINFMCVDKTKKSLILHQEVIDVNNHLPIFDKNRYEYNFGMEIPKDFEITIFQTIKASDDDFTNGNIYFTKQSDEMEILKLEEKGQYCSGYYCTTLKAMENIPPPFKQEFIIVATDEGNPPSSTTATVVINISLPENKTDDVDHPPVFSKHLYLADYTLENTLNLEEKITIKYGAKEKMIVEQSGYKEYFTISQNSLVKEELIVEIKEPLTPEILKENYIIIEVKVTNEGSSYQGLTTLLIDLSKEDESNNSVHPPVFSKHLYLAEYTLENTLNQEEKMTIKYGATEKMNVEQSGYKEYFTISQNSLVKEELIVEIKEPLTPEILKENYIIIEVKVTNEGSSYQGLTTLLIDLSMEDNEGNNSVHPPVFSKTIYFANYTSNEELQMNEMIYIKYGGTDKTIVKQSGYEEFIKISLNELNKTELVAEIIKPFNNETLENDLIVIEITAVNEGLSIPARSNLVLNLQKEFESTCYNVVHIFGYSVDNTVFPLVLFLIAITLIVCVNLIVVSLYFKKNRLNSSTA